VVGQAAEAAQLDADLPVRMRRQRRTGCRGGYHIVAAANNTNQAWNVGGPGL
jgi:hypothetical protein